MELNLRTTFAIIFAATGLILMLGSFVIRSLQMKDAQEKKLNWKFPPKENKIERRNRWTKLTNRRKLRKKFQNFVSSKVMNNFQKEIVMTQVVAAYTESENHLIDLKVENSIYGENVEFNQSVLPERTQKITFFSPIENLEVVKSKLIEILIDAGPPQTLCPILEAEENEVLLDGYDYDEENARDEEDEIEMENSLPLLCKAGRQKGEKSKNFEIPSRFLSEIDPEPIIVINRTAVSREMLWRVAGHLGGQLYRNSTSAMQFDSFSTAEIV